MNQRNWRVAVVGAGPAGLYGADALLKRGAAVDVFESSLAPFGLVRYGVAPDHQKIKKTQIVFERILAKEGLRYFGNVRVGVDLSIAELLEHYDQVLITVGSPGARSLGVPGEELPGSTSATAFVNWYNSHPDFPNPPASVDVDHVAVVGMGNVAIDVARILMRRTSELSSTDISQSALTQLSAAERKSVTLFARRGPNQAAFDEKEVRELAALDGFTVCVDGYISKRSTPMSDFLAQFPRADHVQGRKVVLHFCASPQELRGETRVSLLRLEKNTLVESAARMRAVGTGQFLEVPAGLVIRAIGYHGEALPGVPFASDTGTVPNQDGGVLESHHGVRVPDLYVAGWIKRGPTGLIGTNKSCATATVDLMEKELGQVGPIRDPNGALELLKKRAIRVISCADWRRLNQMEVERGEAEGKIREKFSNLQEALKALEES